MKPNLTGFSKVGKNYRASFAALEFLEPRLQFAAAGVGELAPSIVGDTLPATVVADSKTTATATIELTNNTAGTVSGTAKIALFFSSTPTLGAGATRITRISKVVRVKADHSQSIPIKLKGIPALRDGTYHLVAQISDSKGDVSTAAASETVTVAPPSETLSVAFAPLPADPLATGATVTLTNTGNSAVALLPLSYDQGYSEDAAGQESVGSVIGGFFLGIATQLKVGGHLNLHLSPFDKLSARAGMYYLTFTLVGIGGSTIGLAVSPTQVTVG
jgi:hypothetical protein